jgi:cob(I)alamin adenosyltransferase|tara:strand:- start:7710 stop:8363 length:654 start_codon:yes stop_codon:yes gene_type:complete
MKIYTKTGDQGTTSLYGGGRIHKDTIVFDVLGENDELSSRIGYLCALLENPRREPICDCASKPVCWHARHQCDILSMLRSIQGNLQDINAIIAGTFSTKKLPCFPDSNITEIEKLIDSLEGENTKLTKFILPGVTQIDSQAHMCRTQARKAERYIYRLHHSTEKIGNLKGRKKAILELGSVHIQPSILKYSNRLSDFFFVVARWLCRYISGKKDVYK